MRSTRQRARVRSSQILEPLERRVLMSVSAAAVEPIGGVGNNVANPNWGAAGTDFIRLSPVGYADGIDSPSLPADQSARVISNILNNQADPSDPSQDLNTEDALNVSDFGYAFGQFVDHDLDNTPNGGASDPIAVAAGDPIGPDPLPFTRSLTDPTTGTSTSNPAQQINAISSYLDLSQIYGSSQAVSDALRTMSGGLLKTSPGNLLPLDNTNYFTPAQITALNMANSSQAVPESDLFAAGDDRANENLEITTLETLFVDNHNTIANQLAKENPTWTDQQLFDAARKLNIAEYQNIIYNEWLPALFGANALPAYTGYNPNVDAAVSNEFATVAFRFGHSLVSPTIARDNNDGVTAEPAVPLSDDFFDPYLINPSGATDPLTGLPSSDIGEILKGEADGNGQASDLLAISPIRNLLFGNGGLGGQDLIALDIQRGRDNGMPDYNTMRVAMGLPAVTSFSQISSNPQVVAELEQAYPGGVNTIDAFEGGLAEDHVAGSDVGPLFQAIIVDQFTRARDGDQYFYLNETFTPQEMQILQQGNTLTKVIENNTNVTNLQSDVFYYTESISGTIEMPQVAAGFRSQAQTSASNSGITVDLEDTSGDILASTVTDAKGHFSFNNQDGVYNTGQYVVTMVLPTTDSADVSSANKSRTTWVTAEDVTITRGNENVTVNLGLIKNSDGGGGGNGGTGAVCGNDGGDDSQGFGNGNNSHDHFHLHTSFFGEG